MHKPPPVPKRKKRPVYSPEGAARKSATSKAVVNALQRRPDGTFRKGVSGNPHGKPRVMTGTLAELIAAKVSPNRLAHQLIKLSYAGDPRATDRIVTMLEKLQRPVAPTDLDLSLLSASELKQFEVLARKARGEAVPQESDYNKLMRLRMEVSMLEAKLGEDEEEDEGDEPDEDDEDVELAVSASIPPRAPTPPALEPEDDPEDPDYVDPQSYVGVLGPQLYYDERRKKRAEREEREGNKPN